MQVPSTKANSQPHRSRPQEGQPVSTAGETPVSPAVRAAFWLRASALWMFVAVLARVWLMFRFPLAPDETYYWQWSRHLAWGYYDQGPMVAFWIRGSCLLFGESVLGIRAGIVLAAFLTQLYVWLLARDLFGPRIAFLSLLPGTVPPLALAGGFIATYDPLVALFWAAAAYYASRACFRGSRWAWVGLGAAFGLGMLCKHTMVFFLPCFALFLIAGPDQRRWFTRKEPWLALLLALAIFSPNLWWQSHNGWMTFKHLFLLAGKGLDRPFYSRLGDFVGSQVGVITPILFVLYVIALVWTYKRGRETQNQGDADESSDAGRYWYLFCLSAPVLIFFTIMTAKSKVQANWAVCGWLTPPILLALWYDYRQTQFEAGERKAARFFARPAFWPVFGLGLSLFLSLLLAVQETRPLLPFQLPSRWDQMNKLYGGAEAGAAADRVRQAMTQETGKPVAVGAVTYDNASQLAFYMTGQPDSCCLFPGTRFNSYGLWNASTLPPVGGNLLLLDDLASNDPKLAPFRDLFDRVEVEPAPIYAYRQGVYKTPVHTYYLYRCYGYRPNPAIETPKGG